MSDTVIMSIVSGLVTVVTMVLGFLTLWLKLKYGVENKIDHNTTLTQEGTAAAKRGTDAAVRTSSDAKNAIKSISDRLNGGIDESINTAVGPVKQMLLDHVTELDKFQEYSHQRNHDILGYIHTLTTQLAVLLERLDQGKEVKQKGNGP